MFKKKSSKSLSSPPPLTTDQILEDLKTFQTAKDEEFTETRYISPNQPDYDQEWWKAFETYLSDVKQLEELQDQFKSGRGDLKRKKKDLNKVIGDLEQQLEARKSEVENIQKDNGFE